MISPLTLARIYSEAYKAHIEKEPYNTSGARSYAQQACYDFVYWYKNNATFIGSS